MFRQNHRCAQPPASGPFARHLSGPTRDKPEQASPAVFRHPPPADNLLQSVPKEFSPPQISEPASLRGPSQEETSNYQGVQFPVLRQSISLVSSSPAREQIVSLSHGHILRNSHRVHRSAPHIWTRPR